MTNDNLKKVQELMQLNPRPDDIVQQIEALIDTEPNIAVKRMMGMSLSAVLLDLEEQGIEKNKQ